MSRHFYAIAAIMAVLSVASFGSTHLKMKAAVPAVSNVVVTNSSSQPIPVTGSVGLANNASVSVNGAVALASGTTVNLPYDSNNPLPSRDVDMASHVPVEISADVNLHDGDTQVAGIQLYTVPAGKRLVIQTLFGTAINPPGEKVLNAMIDSNSPSFTGHQFPLLFQVSGTSTAEYENAMTQTTAYVEPGSIVSVEATRSGSSATSLYTIGFSGYLENAS